MNEANTWQTVGITKPMPTSPPDLDSRDPTRVGSNSHGRIPQRVKWHGTHVARIAITPKTIGTTINVVTNFVCRASKPTLTGQKKKRRTDHSLEWSTADELRPIKQRQPDSAQRRASSGTWQPNLDPWQKGKLLPRRGSFRPVNSVLKTEDRSNWTQLVDGRLSLHQCDVRPCLWTRTSAVTGAPHAHSSTSISQLANGSVLP